MSDILSEHRGDLTRREMLTRAGGMAAGLMLPGASLRERTLDASMRGPWGPTQEAFPRRRDFTIPDGVTYLNGAFMHPMPDAVRDAVRAYNDRRAGFTTQTSSEPDIGARVRADFAALIGAEPDEVAFVPNTSSGEVLVVQGLDIPASGGNVVTDGLHFEGAVVHLQALERAHGLDLRIVMPREGAIALEDLERAIDHDTRLVELSLVSMYNGFQHDLQAVCEVAHAHGAYVYADVIQAAGAVPIDVTESDVDFLACSGFKWLMADLGLGFLYARRDLLERVLRRTRYGYHSVTRYQTHFLPYDPPAAEPFSWELGQSASAVFEVGSVAGAARAALGASLPYLSDLGVQRIEEHRQPLLRRLRQELPKLGLRCVTPPDTRSPIITFTMEDGDAVARRLSGAGIDARVTPHWVRFSPSVYNGMDDVERVLEALA